jgi:hypothetical protein
LEFKKAALKRTQSKRFGVLRLWKKFSTPSLPSEAGGEGRGGF